MEVYLTLKLPHPSAWEGTICEGIQPSYSRSSLSWCWGGYCSVSRALKMASGATSNQAPQASNHQPMLMPQDPSMTMGGENDEDGNDEEDEDEDGYGESTEEE